MEMAFVFLAYAIGIAFIAFVIVIIVAVLKASSDSDDLEDRIHYQAREGLNERDHSTVQRKRLDDKGTGKGEWDTAEHDVPETHVSGVVGRRGR